MPYPRSETRAQKTISDIYALEMQIGTLLLEVDEKKKSLGAYFDETGSKSLVAEPETSGLNVVLKGMKVERATIQYDPEKLKKKIDDDAFIEVTTRDYKIKDIERMIALMKEAGISARKFKDLISVDVKVHNDKVKFLYDNNELTMDQLKGCFTAKISKSIRVAEVKKGKGDSD